MRGTDAETGGKLPGFEGGRGKVSTTEKVRMRGIIERTRVAIVEVAGKDGSVTEAGSATETDVDMSSEDGDVTVDGLQVEDDPGKWEMEVARVYEKTIVELGASLDTS